MVDVYFIYALLIKCNSTQKMIHFTIMYSQCIYLTMQLLVDFVYTFRNFVTFTSKKQNVAVYK